MSIAVKGAMPSWMLARLKRETQGLRASADEGRLEPLRTTATRASYVSYLSRIFGFEAPIEAAFAATRDLGYLVDLRWRPNIRLLRADLTALGVVEPARLPATPMPRFATVTEALGWMYVVEQNVTLHGQLHRHFARWLPGELAAAGCYLSRGDRLDDLGAALDAHATRPEIATKIVDAACTAFRRQRLWFLKSLPLEVSRDVAR
jgi:heme oxygenase